MFGEFGSQVTCAKKRIEDKRIITIAQGDCTGQHVLIVDDLVQTGGTLLECAEALLKHGALSVSCFVAHAIFPNKSWMRFLTPTVKQFITTNSYHQDLLEKQKTFWHEENRNKFVVLDIEDLIVSDL
jgi:phosphoribosylpyrophosphate synthetase